MGKDQWETSPSETVCERSHHPRPTLCPQRRRESSLLSLVESRLWGAISPASDARPTLPLVEYTYQDLTDTFKIQPSLLGVIDTYGIELIHPRREGHSEKQIGRKGLSNQRWIVGGKLF